MAEDAEINQWIKDIRDAILNLIIVSPHSIRNDETFLDLDASVTNLEKTNRDDRDAVIIAAKEAGRDLANFLRVHPEYEKDKRYIPFIQELKQILQKLLSI